MVIRFGEWQLPKIKPDMKFPSEVGAHLSQEFGLGHGHCGGEGSLREWCF